jgi:acyl-CoA hydrolase
MEQFIELVGEFTKVGNTSLTGRAVIHIEQMFSDEKEIAVSGNFSFVAIDEDKRPVRILRDGLKKEDPFALLLEEGKSFCGYFQP